MQVYLRLLFVCLLALLTIPAAFAQTPSSTQTSDPSITANGVIGEIKVIDAAAKQLIVKTDGGSLVTVTVADNTSYLRLAPGETTLTNATKVTFAELGEGDRVFARGTPAEDRKSIAPRVVIVMSKADIAKKQEAERAEWRRRGLLGVVTSLNPSTKEITISSRSMGATQSVVIPVTDKVELKRYAPDSIKFSDAKVTKFEELRVGDQLRALGDRSADGNTFTAERVVTGAFQTVAGSVTEINPATGELKISDLQTKQPLTVVIKQDAILRRFPPMSEMGAMMSMVSRPGGGAGGPGQSSGQQQGQAGNRPAGPGQGGPGAGRPGGGFNIQEMLERLPAITTADLKVGDTIVVSSTKGADASRLTAITLVSGADTLLTMLAARQQQPGQAPNPAAGIGSGGFQIGIGLP